MRMQQSKSDNHPAFVSTQMLSPSDIAALLRISRRTLQTWRAAGKLPPPDLHIGKVIRWKPESIESWLSEKQPQNRR